MTSSKRAYAITRSAAPRGPALWQAIADPYLHRRCSTTVLSQSLWGPGSWYAQGLFEPSEHLWRKWGLVLNVNLPLLPSCWGFSFALGHGVSPHSHSSAYHLSGLSLTYMRSPWLIYYSLKLYTFEYHQSYTSVPFPHNHQFSLCFCKFSFLDSSCEIIQYLSFSSDISLSKMWSSSIHVVANVRTSTCLVSEPH